MKRLKNVILSHPVSTVTTTLKSKNLKLELRRIIKSEVCTIGELYADGEFECYTLEDRERHGLKVPGETAIPFGTYTVVVTRSQRFQRLLPLLLEVPEFSGVRIHPGNTAKDTGGCILVGETKTQDAVLSSRKAFDILFDKIKQADSCEIDIH